MQRIDQSSHRFCYFLETASPVVRYWEFLSPAIRRNHRELDAFDELDEALVLTRVQLCIMQYISLE